MPHFKMPQVFNGCQQRNAVKVTLEAAWLLRAEYASGTRGHDWVARPVIYWNAWRHFIFATLHRMLDFALSKWWRASLIYGPARLRWHTSRTGRLLTILILIYSGRILRIIIEVYFALKRQRYFRVISLHGKLFIDMSHWWLVASTIYFDICAFSFETDEAPNTPKPLHHALLLIECWSSRNRVITRWGNILI